MENTTYLHNHSVYSLFDGAQTIKEMVERAKELGCIWSKFYTAISTGAVYILTGRYEIKDGKSSFIINDINESLTNGEDFLVHVDSWKEWNTKYYPEAIKKSSINGSTLYVHNRKSGQIIRFSKKIKNFSNFKEAKYAFIHK